MPAPAPQLTLRPWVYALLPALAATEPHCLTCCLPRPCRFGASADHWRKNLPVLGQGCRAFAIDLLGYGYSDKVQGGTAWAAWQQRPHSADGGP